MSGICGIYNIDRAPAQASDLAKMMAATPFRGPDGSGSWLRGPLALGHQLLVTAPEASPEIQPLRDENADLTIVFDGRIDNRQELLGAMQPGWVAGNGMTDAALVLQAYRCWGKRCCSRLYGDFAFVIWDEANRRLCAARDCFGVKPLYYFFDGKRFVFGSEQVQILQLPLVPRRVNEGMVGELLVRKITSASDTLYRDIQRLPPAHMLCIEGDQLEVTRYWELTTREPLVYRRWEEYVEHFLELLGQAVADRLRSVGRPGLYLSGGLDSSAIAGMAQTILNSRGEGVRLDTYSITLDPASCVDELPCIRSVVEQWGLGSHRSHFTGVGQPDWAAQVRATLELPDFPTITMTQPLRKQAVASGVKVLLSGAGADSFLGGGIYPYQDLLCAGGWGALVDELRWQAVSIGWRGAVTRLSRSLAWPLLPQSLRARAEAMRRLTPANTCIRPDFARGIELESRLHRNDSRGEFANLGHWDYWRHGQRAQVAMGLEFEDRADARSGLDQRHPFYDLRLVEFASALPPRVKQCGDRNKRLLRQSGLLPPRVQQDPAHAEFSISAYSAVRTGFAAHTLSDLGLARRGWVDQAWIDAALANMAAPFRELSSAQKLQAVNLWWVFAVELWLDNAGLHR